VELGWRGKSGARVVGQGVKVIYRWICIVVRVTQRAGFGKKVNNSSEGERGRRLSVDEG